jgi:hypothetical protein
LRFVGCWGRKLPRQGTENTFTWCMRCAGKLSHFLEQEDWGTAQFPLTISTRNRTTPGQPYWIL